MAYKYTDGDHVIRISDGAMIPPDVYNVEHQEYLRWLADGNEPEPYVAPEPVVLTPEEKLAAAGLTAEDLKSILGLK